MIFHMNHKQKGIQKSEAYMYTAPQSVANDVTDKVLNHKITTVSPHSLSIIPILYKGKYIWPVVVISRTVLLHSLSIKRSDYILINRISASASNVFSSLLCR